MYNITIYKLQLTLVMSKLKGAEKNNINYFNSINSIIIFIVGLVGSNLYLADTRTYSMHYTVLYVQVCGVVYDKNYYIFRIVLTPKP